VPGDERASRARRGVNDTDEAVLDVLRGGEIELLGLLPRSSNYTFLTYVGGPEDRVLAVYKPRAGEAPLWDFPRGTLCHREVAAYVVAAALGWPWVPPTVLRDGPHGEGSVQLFVAFDPADHYLTMLEEHPDDFRRIALFDLVVNNADRKSGHVLRSTDGRVFSVDHGVCFNDEPKLRTVIWDFVGEEIPRELAEDLGRLARGLSGGPVADALDGLLDASELRAMRVRVADLLRAGSFPEPGPGRPYPWPVV
jgi:hypothetical protein